MTPVRGSSDSHAAMRSAAAVSAPLQASFADRGRTHPCVAISCRLVIQRLDSANSVCSCAVFYSSPRYRTFSWLHRRLITRHGCSTLARMLALTCSIRSVIASFGLALSSSRRSLWRSATCRRVRMSWVSPRLSTLW